MLILSSQLISIGVSPTLFCLGAGLSRVGRMIMRCKPLLKIRDLKLRTLASLLLLGLLVEIVGASVYYSLVMESNVACSSPSIALQNGTAGSSIVYSYNTSAKVSTTASAPTPTYYPNSYNIMAGTRLSGSVPASVQSVDSEYFVVQSSGTAPLSPSYSPFNYTLLGSTTLDSGTTANLVSNNGVYMTFRSYASETSNETLYAHKETTMIGGTNYYLQKLTSADATGMNLNASMATAGRQTLGKFVYQLTGKSLIPASTWTMYYRAWHDTAPSIASDSQSSMVQSTVASSISWNHTTGAGSNRLLLVAVAIHKDNGGPTTVTGVTYDGVSLTQVTTDLYSTQNPQVRTYVFRLINPTSGTKTITINFQAATLSVAGAVTFTGVDQTNPIQTSNTATGSGTTPSVAVTVTGSGRWIFGHLAGHRIASDWTITEGIGQMQRWAQTGQLYKGVGSDKSVSAGSQSMSWSLNQAASYVASAVAINPALAGHLDVDILIRQSDGTIRTTIATNVANSGELASTPATLSGTYSWAAYNVVNQTDYLEIDYYVDVTAALSGISAYLRIDDDMFSKADQTRIINFIVGIEFTSEVEFIGLSNNYTWTKLVWTIDSAWTIDAVTVTIQVYNYTLGSYPTSGNGYDSYVSSATANTDEERTKTITINAQHFRDGSGNWKIKIKGVKSTSTQFDFKADWVEFKPTYNSKYTASTEFQFSSMTQNTPTQLNFTIVSEYNIANVNVTIQVWNYSSSAYATSGEGYLTYASSSSNETKLLSINTNSQFYSTNGNTKIKITGSKTNTTQYQQEVNQAKLDYRYNASSNYNYVLRIVNQVSDPWKIRLKAYSQSNIARLSNCTIYFRNSTNGTSRQIYIENGAYVNQTGPWYDLPASEERYIAVTLQATNSEVSYIDVYLEILIPNKTTYAQCVVTFEIT